MSSTTGRTSSGVHSPNDPILTWRWDSNSRTRQHRLIVLVVLCATILAVLHLTTAEPTMTDNGRIIETTGDEHG